MISEVIQKACLSHYKLKLQLEHDGNGNIKLVHESLRCSSSQGSSNCLCVNFAQEQSVSSVPLVFTALRRPNIEMNVYVTETRSSLVPITVYHIIPLPLITRFFDYWLSDTVAFPNNSFNDCVKTLFFRLKRSMQKLLIVNIKRTRLFRDRLEPPSANENPFDPDNIFSVSDIRYATSLLSGNCKSVRPIEGRSIQGLTQQVCNR